MPSAEGIKPLAFRLGAQRFFADLSASAAFGFSNFLKQKTSLLNFATW